jgi:hypothetical protein
MEGVAPARGAFQTAKLIVDETCPPRVFRIDRRCPTKRRNKATRSSADEKHRSSQAPVEIHNFDETKPNKCRSIRTLVFSTMHRRRISAPDTIEFVKNKPTQDGELSVDFRFPTRPEWISEKTNPPPYRHYVDKVEKASSPNTPGRSCRPPPRGCRYRGPD